MCCILNIRLKRSRKVSGLMGNLTHNGKRFVSIAIQSISTYIASNTESIITTAISILYHIVTTPLPSRRGSPGPRSLSLSLCMLPSSLPLEPSAVLESSESRFVGVAKLMWVSVGRRCSWVSNGLTLEREDDDEEEKRTHLGDVPCLERVVRPPGYARLGGAHLKALEHAVRERPPRVQPDVLASADGPNQAAVHTYTASTELA